MEIDLLNQDAATEVSKHKLKRLVQSPNSFFMDVRCRNCSDFALNTIFSHISTVVLCPK